MSRWTPTAALARSFVVGVVGIAWAVLAGEPAVLVLVTPFVVSGVLARLARPTSTPQPASGLDHVSLTEGLATTSRLRLGGADPDQQAGRVDRVDRDVETVTRSQARRALVVAADGRARAASSTTTWHVPDADHAVVLSPRRWGLHEVGAEQVALASPWAGYRWGPVRLGASRMRVLPAAPAYRSAAEVPRPRGLVGAHRATRAGAGTELAGIRPYAPGDRLRSINWRVSARTPTLQVTTTRAELDAGLLLVVDLLAEHGVSGGVDGRASSLDLTVRAAAALAEHAVRCGDRVALRPVGGRGRPVPPGAGRRHLQRMLGGLSELEAGSSGVDAETRLVLRVPSGTTVVVLSPLLVTTVVDAAADLVRRGLPVVVVDTLPPADDAAFDDGVDPVVGALAWRMRMLDRELLVTALSSLGCPVVPWSGAGTVDEAMRRLARQADLPRAR